MEYARELAMERAKERDKAAWILDFILRQQMDESVKNGIYDYLPDGADNPHFKKTMLLHWIGSHLAKHSISENTLQCLESIAKLDRNVGNEVPESLKEAYCAVAVECTSSTLRESSHTDPEDFFDAVKRIWIRRVPYLGQSEAAGLFSDHLEVMRKLMKMAVVSPAAREGMLSWDAKGEALNSLNKYLNEALNAMGPPPLELMIETMIREGKVCKDGSRPARESGVPAAQRPTDGASPLHLGCLAPGLNRETAGQVLGSDIPERSTRARGFDAPWQWLMNEALKLGPAEVQMIVEDPLTNEVSMSFEVPSSMGHEAMNPTPLEPSQDMNVPDLFGNPSTCNFELDDASIEAPAKESPSSSRNARLYNLRERETSPLQVNESSKVGTRRKIKRWSTLEKDTLRQAVERDGRKWKFILGLHPQIFEDRTEVDLKDKWRNMTGH